MTERTRPRWLLLALGVVAIAAVAFAIGRFTAFGATAVPPTPATDSADAGFARDMQVHHAQAIDMAMTIHRETSDEQLRVLAYDIATGQAAQKGEMFGWLVQWGLPQTGGTLMSWMADSDAHAHDPAASEEELMAEMGMATDAQLAELDAATGTAADCLFLDLMIRHHEGAVPMAQAATELASDPRVRQVADGMVATQSAEIDAMTSMRTRMACTA